ARPRTSISNVRRFRSHALSREPARTRSASRVCPVRGRAPAWKHSFPLSHRLSMGMMGQALQIVKRLLAAGLERRVSEEIENMAINEEIGQLRRGYCEFRMTIKRVRHAFESVKLDRNIRVAELLHETLTTLDRDRDVFVTMEDDCRRKSGSNVRRRIRCAFR